MIGTATVITNSTALFYPKGAGSGLLTHPSRLESIIRGVDQVLRKAVVTVKMRSAIKEHKNIAHQLIPGIQQAGAVLITVSIHPLTDCCVKIQFHLYYTTIFIFRFCASSDPRT